MMLRIRSNGLFNLRVQKPRRYPYSIFTFGVNNQGQLGQQDTFNRHFPTRIVFDKAASTDIKHIAAGHYHSLCVADDHVFAWGNNKDSQLGLGDTFYDRDILKPTPIDQRAFQQSDAPNVVSHIACSRFNSFAVLDNKRLYSWGRGRSEDGYHIGYKSPQEHIPRQVPLPFSEEIASISAGWCHMMILTASGALYTFGYGKDGQLGLSALRENVIQPTLIPFFQNKPVRQVACGLDHTLVLTVDGDVYSFGLNNYGQLGLGNPSVVGEDVPMPVQIDALSGKNIKSLAAGWSHSIALTDSGELYSWGWDEGQLGIETDRDRGIQHDSFANFVAEPTKITTLEGVCITNVACGRVHTAAIDSEGHLLIWGKGGDGRLGLGDGDDRRTPTWVSDFDDPLADKSKQNSDGFVYVKSTRVACGCDHTIVVTTEQT